MSRPENRENLQSLADQIVWALETYMPIYEHQPDAAISQDNPVSTTLYPVLPTTLNVIIYSIETDLVWDTTQPTPIEVLITIDGNTIIHTQADPVTATPYYCRRTPAAAEAGQLMTNDEAIAMNEAAPLYGGRSIKVEVRVTWATTQPTPLVCRIKWAKIP